MNKEVHELKQAETDLEDIIDNKEIDSFEKDIKVSNKHENLIFIIVLIFIAVVLINNMIWFIQFKKR